MPPLIPSPPPSWLHCSRRHLPPPVLPRSAFPPPQVLPSCCLSSAATSPLPSPSPDGGVKATMAGDGDGRHVSRLYGCGTTLAGGCGGRCASSGARRKRRQQATDGVRGARGLERCEGPVAAGIWMRGARAPQWWGSCLGYIPMYLQGSYPQGKRSRTPNTIPL